MRSISQAKPHISQLLPDISQKSTASPYHKMFISCYMFLSQQRANVHDNQGHADLLTTADDDFCYRSPLTGFAALLVSRSYHEAGLFAHRSSGESAARGRAWKHVLLDLRNCRVSDATSVSTPMI